MDTGFVWIIGLEEIRLPLKPIYEKSPMMPLSALPLRAGGFRVSRDGVLRLYEMTKRASDRPELWEGAFRLACAITKKPLEEPVAGWITGALAAPGAAGALPAHAARGVAIARAAFAMYERDARRPLLEKLLRYCAHLAANWERVMACGAIRTRPADLMALLEALYRVTGKKSVAALCARLREQGMDWSGVLRTFAVQRPMCRVTPWRDMEAGLEAEEGSEAGFYTRQYLTCHGEALADGARSATLCGLFSGNGQELSAAKTGWEKLRRYHGAVCGGVTADETLAGASPSAGVDAAALGAWAEALAAQGAAGDDPWAFEALETLLENGLSAAVGEEGLVPFQRVNGLSANCGTKDCYHTTSDEAQTCRALNRLCRGWAAAISAAVMTRPEGAQVNLLLPGRYALPVGGQTGVISVSGGEGEYRLSWALKQGAEAALRVRIPARAENVSLLVNDEPAEAAEPGAYATLTRVWQDGDTVTLRCGRALRVHEGHHQSCWVTLGAQVLAYPASAEDWAVALCGEPEINAAGEVVAPVRSVPDWRRKGSVPADVPVLPETAGETRKIRLTPYAQTPCRIAMFPRGRSDG